MRRQSITLHLSRMSWRCVTTVLHVCSGVVEVTAHSGNLITSAWDGNGRMIMRSGKRFFDLIRHAARRDNCKAKQRRTGKASK